MQKIYYLLFVTGLFYLTLHPATAQIEMNSSGNVGIGGYTPNNSYDFRSYSGSVSNLFAGNLNGGYSTFYRATTHGNMGIGTSWSGNNTLTVNTLSGEAQHTIYIGSQSWDHALYVNGDAYAFGVWLGSDKNLKKNIKSLDRKSIKEKLKKLRGTSYDFKGKEELLALHNSGEARFHVDTLYRMDSVLLEDKTLQVIPTDEILEIKVDVPQYQEGKTYGLIAQEVQEVFPELVRQDESTKMYAINYQGFIPILLDLVNAQQEQLESLEARLAKIEAKDKDKSSSSSRTDEEVDTSNDPLQGVNLLQNSPNPFSDQTEIAFTLSPDAQEATLFIYDLQGTQVKSYPITQRGAGSITIQGSELKAGIYLYSLIVDGELVGTEKMVLTK